MPPYGIKISRKKANLAAHKYNRKSPCGQFSTISDELKDDFLAQAQQNKRLIAVNAYAL